MKTVTVDPRGKIGLPADIGTEVIFKDEEVEILLRKVGKAHQAWEIVKGEDLTTDEDEEKFVEEANKLLELEDETIEDNEQ